MRPVYVFRNDLRIEQNHLFHSFFREHSGKHAIFLSTPSMTRAKGFRKKWLDLHREDLKDRLEVLGIECLNEWKKGDLLFISDEVGTEEREQCRAIERDPELRVFLGSSNQLIALSEIPKNDVPEIFSSFRRRYEERITAKTDLPWFNIRGPLSASVGKFRVGESFAIESVQDFIWGSRRILTYAETRNGMLHFRDSSKFSPYLALGVLSVSWIFSEILRFEQEYGPHPSIDHFKMELLWREYFRFIHEKKGTSWYVARQRVECDPKEQDQRFRNWTEGKTGQPFIDANMRELLSTGFMSNRGRQNVASYLSKIMKVDFKKGASFFESYLIDYDVCNNWGNWAYLAGVGQDPRDRVFNPKVQAERYDPDGSYVKKWLF